MTKIFLLPTRSVKNNAHVIAQINEAAKISPLCLVFPKNGQADNTPPEPPPMAA